MARRKPGHPWAALKGDDPALHELAGYLRGLVDHAAMTMARLAAELGCSSATVSKRLNGALLPDREFVIDLARACVPDPRIRDRRVAEATTRWEQARRDEGRRIRRRDDHLADPRTLIMNSQTAAVDAQQRLIKAHDELSELYGQLLASVRAEQQTTKLIWALKWTLARVVDSVTQLSAQRDNALAQAKATEAERDAVGRKLAAAIQAQERTEDQLDRATIEHQRAQELVATAEAEIKSLRGMLRSEEMVFDVTGAVGDEVLDGINADLDWTNELLDEQAAELARLATQIQHRTPDPDAVLRWRQTERIVDTLERVNSLRDSAGRQLCLELLSAHLGYPLPIQEFPSPRMHLFGIVLQLQRKPDEFRLFVDVVSGMEPGSLAVRALRDLLDTEPFSSCGDLVVL
ncbi:transcriptional regulator with XRE-family HTH domain [Kibdelosporangium banguiense]|uniref:Transcriptional regulator with XRE-family HTH domain n=1 Tax=Kibdelosporangium banguiense TaxID=1365924 RepID=A0ABS4U027_9PSEU|nr:helix-turn-helix domain-containing protein [Kibdelosporangium banguiense]MBP2329525.1 transcriptional regulator with XRE-family HTH domain [Kibdelosporangium banguiense]